MSIEWSQFASEMEETQTKFSMALVPFPIYSISSPKPSSDDNDDDVDDNYTKCSLLSSGKKDCFHYRGRVLFGLNF